MLEASRRPGRAARARSAPAGPRSSCRGCRRSSASRPPETRCTETGRGTRQAGSPHGAGQAATGRPGSCSIQPRRPPRSRREAHAQDLDAFREPRAVGARSSTTNTNVVVDRSRSTRRPTAFRVNRPKPRRESQLVASTPTRTAVTGPEQAAAAAEEPSDRLAAGPDERVEQDQRRRAGELTPYRPVLPTFRTTRRYMSGTRSGEPMRRSSASSRAPRCACRRRSASSGIAATGTRTGRSPSHGRAPFGLVPELEAALQRDERGASPPSVPRAAGRRSRRWRSGRRRRSCREGRRRRPAGTGGR